MRTMLVLTALASTASADPLHDAIDGWPNTGAALTAQRLDKALWDGEPCSAMERPGPAIDDRTSVVVSPDRKRVAVVASFVLDADQAKALGATPGLLARVLILDQDGGIHAYEPNTFRRCVDSSALEWSSDSQRVLASYDSGHGMRVALASLELGHRARAGLLVDAFTTVDFAASPGLRHVASVPWSDGWPEESGDDHLYIDRQLVFARHTTIEKLVWTSDDELTFCAGNNRYRWTGKLARGGTCSP
jgi:hypothetical protein